MYVTCVAQIMYRWLEELCWTVGKWIGQIAKQKIRFSGRVACVGSLVRSFISSPQNQIKQKI